MVRAELGSGHDTDALIEQLALSAAPVRRLQCPGWRVVGWLVVSAVSVAVFVFAMSPRPDLAVKLTETRFLVEQLAAGITAILAAYAACMLTVPGRSQKVVVLVALPLTVWLASIGEGCWQTLVQHGLDELYFQPDWMCLPVIAAVGAGPAIAIVIMIRRGAPIFPRATVTLGALAAAAIGNFGLRLVHLEDASFMILIWQFGAVALLASLGGLFAKRFFFWSHSP